MRKLLLEEFNEYNADEIVAGLRAGDFSLLQSLGFHKLKAEMNFTGLICRLIIYITGMRQALKKSPKGLPSNAPALRRVRKLLKFAAPGTVVGAMPNRHEGMIFGFNHPSLGEILRFIYVCATEYRLKRNLFPVNLPWYEAITPIANELEQIGIYIMPVITPSTRRKMAKTAELETIAIIDKLSQDMNLLYLNECVDFIKHGDNVWLAPTATRQRTVFASKGCFDGAEEIKPQTMTLLAIALRRNRASECEFFPVGVKPSRNFRRGLNLFRHYKFAIGDAISYEDAVKAARTPCVNCGGSEFEREFLTKIAEKVKELGGANLIYPKV